MSSAYSNPAINRALARMDAQIERSARLINQLTETMVRIANTRQELRYQAAEWIFVRKMQEISKKPIKRGGRNGK